MIERKRLLSLGYYNKAASFTGSDKAKHYRIEKYIEKQATETVNDAGETVTEIEQIKKLKATIWPGPFSFENTDDDKKQSKLEEFSEEGLQALVDWMNSLAMD